MYSKWMYSHSLNSIPGVGDANKFKISFQSVLAEQFAKQGYYGQLLSSSSAASNEPDEFIRKKSLHQDVLTGVQMVHMHPMRPR